MAFSNDLFAIFCFMIGFKIGVFMQSKADLRKTQALSNKPNKANKHVNLSKSNQNWKEPRDFTEAFRLCAKINKITQEM